MKEFSEEKSMEIDIKKELSQKLSFIRKKYEDEYKMFSRLLGIMIFQLWSAGAYGVLTRFFICIKHNQERYYMIMGHFGMLRFYLKGFYETILAYASVKLLPVGQRNPVSFNVYSSISNLTFCFKEKVSLEIII